MIVIYKSCQWIFSFTLRYRKTGTEKTFNLFCNIAAKRLNSDVARVLPTTFKPVNNLICCKTGSNLLTT